MLLPDGVKRAVLDGASARANIEKLGLDPDTVLAGVIEIGRLEADAYDDLLSGQSGELHVLTLRTDGPACTLGCRMRAANASACTTHALHNRLRGTRLSAVIRCVRSPIDVREFLTHERICSASSHLARLSTPWLSVEEFIRGAKESAVLRGLCPYSRFSTRKTARFLGGTDGVDDVSARYDVTVLVCSYKGVQNLRVIINALMCGQDFAGNVEIFVWNNNRSESDAVQCIVRTFATRNSGARFLRWVESSTNYYSTRDWLARR